MTPDRITITLPTGHTVRTANSRRYFVLYAPSGPITATTAYVVKRTDNLTTARRARNGYPHRVIFDAATGSFI